MKTRFNLLAACVTLASVSSIASAGLLPGLSAKTGITYFTGGANVDREVVLAGASAPDLAISDLLTQNCVAGTLTQFTDRCNANESGATCSTGTGTPGALIPGSSYTAYFCTLDHTKVSGLSADQNVLFRKRSAGGSGIGAGPVAFSDATVQQMLINSANCVNTPNGVYFCNKSNLTTSGDANYIPDIGFSDLPPGEFIGPNTPTPFAACDSTCTANLVTQSNYALTFGIPVTSALYIALQKAQGLNTDTNGNNVADVLEQQVFVNGSAADQKAYRDNMPTLSQEQVASLFTSRIANWNRVFFNNVALTATAGVTAPTDSHVFICRRGAGSGTQSQLNANFLHVPCTAAADQPAAETTPCISNTGVADTTCSASAASWAVPGTVTGGTNAPIVHDASGSGDVDNCLGTIQAANDWAVGNLGLDTVTKFPNSWSFVKISGYAPTLQDVAQGHYPAWGGESVQWRVGTSGDLLAIAQDIVSEAANPTELNTINNLVKWPFGPAGALSLSAAATRTAGAIFDPTKPIMEYTRNNKTCNVSKPRNSAVSTSGVDF